MPSGYVNRDTINTRRPLTNSQVSYPPAGRVALASLDQEHSVHEILDRAGHPHRGTRSCGLLLNALEGSPLFEKKLTRVGGRFFRDFQLLDPAPPGGPPS